MKKNSLIFAFALLILLASTKCHKTREKSGDTTRNPNFSLTGLLHRMQKDYAPDPRDHVFEYRIDTVDSLHIRIDITTDAVNHTALTQVKNDETGLIYSFRWHILPDSLPEGNRAVVRLSVANLRTRSAHSAELASQMLMGMPVQVLERRNGFYRIRTTEGYLGWADAAALHFMDSTAYGKWLARPKLIMLENCGKIYADIKPNSPQISDVVRNDVVALVRETPYFLAVELPDGRRGFVPSGPFTSLDEWEQLNRRFANPADMISEALTEYPGIPYLWGGTSVKGLDCSGFVKNLYHSYGLLLPRDASQQARIGRPVPLTPALDSLQPADLLFFGPTGDHITHVALYIGNGRIIHATGMVRVESLLPGDSLYNDERRKTLRSARRILGYYHRRLYPFYTGKDSK